MSDLEQAASFAIAAAKNQGLAEIGPDELLLGCLRAVSRFGVVALGSLVIDLEELGVVWLERPDGTAPKVAYSKAVVEIFDLATQIALSAGPGQVRVEHLLAAFASEEAGLMGDLKRRYGITNASWRAAVAVFAGQSLGQMPVQAPEATRMDAAKVMDVGRDFLTPEEAAEALGIHVQTLRGYVRSGKLPALRLAGERAIRIRRADLEQVLEPLAPQN